MLQRMYHVWFVSPTEVRMIPPTHIEIVYIWVKLRLRKFSQVLGLFHTNLPIRVSHLTLNTKMGLIAKIS